MGHIDRMDKSLIKKWTKSVGGIDEATQRIKERLKCSYSKAQKLAYGRYPSSPRPLEQIALAELIGCPHEVLFPNGKKSKTLIAS